jgi:hypothetical protein
MKEIVSYMTIDNVMKIVHKFRLEMVRLDFMTDEQIINIPKLKLFNFNDLYDIIFKRTGR